MTDPVNTYHIHLQGQVQGVGFRPFVYQLAQAHGLCGWVNNSVDGVHIEINADADAATAFFTDLQERAPALSRITASTIKSSNYIDYKDFRIIHSNEAGEATLLLTPDVAICKACLAELYDPTNRRAGYPFITCTNCGPRYSIIHQLPYDRPYTTMQPFSMCKRCAEEYDNPLDRRYYSQTNSCPDCAITLTWFSKEEGVVAGDAHELIRKTASAILEGKIIAVKGIGGFLLCCDATHEKAIRTLRARKHRPTKPFALMYPSLSTLQLDAGLHPLERKEIEGHAAPILLAELRKTPLSGLKMDAIAPGLSQVGAMLPYAPLFELILQQVQRPIIATSGNLSNAPIVFDNETALAELAEIADAVLLHNRDIATPQDDSVIRFTPFHQQRIVLRRSRGIAPTFILPGLAAPDTTVLAMGAMMKSAFALAHNKNFYLSQYLGDLENYDTERSFQHALHHLLNLFSATPKHVVADLHPNYFSTRLGESLAAQWEVPMWHYQHHKAHFAAVLGEHQLLCDAEPVLGVIWDGTGLGTDGQVWGGEFFRYDGGAFQRVGQLDYFPFILGDKMPREPRISALAACAELPEASALLEGHFSPTEWVIYHKLLRRTNNLQTSSMGRLFDAAAALLGISSRSTYEGEAAMLLENAASDAFKRAGLHGFQAFELAENAGLNMSPTTLLYPLIEGIQSRVDIPTLAARFHLTLVRWIERAARQSGLRRIAFSGGVFQNALLTDLLLHHLRPEFSLYFHQQLPPNDENIAFGQLVLFSMKPG